MAAKKSPPEQTAKFTDLEPAGPASEPAFPPTPDPIVDMGQVKGTDARKSGCRIAAFKVEAVVEAFKALNEEIDALHRRIKGHEEKALEAAEKALALSVEEIMQGIDLALTHMAAGTTQNEAVSLAAEAIRKEKQESPS